MVLNLSHTVTGFPTIAMFVILDLKTIFNMKFEEKFVTHLQMK